MAKKETPLTTQRIEKLLGEQTKVILNAVDEKMGRMDNRIDKFEQSIGLKLSTLEIRLLAEMDKKILASEERINRKIDKLTTTLDKFLKRMTDMEDEFTIMKHDLNRVKQILKEKLGVDLA